MGPFFVVGGEVSTGVFVKPGDKLQTLSTGFVNFGGAVLGIGAPILPADGDNWETPSDYPAPQLKKNSLIFRIRPSGAEAPPFTWFQGGTNATVLIPPGANSGEVILRTNDGHPEDNTG